MKIACIGDIHGVDRWKEARDLEVDHYVFIGDYVDSEQIISDEAIFQNLKEIVQFKSDLEEQVSLLLGNHDIQYLFWPKFRCSGYRPKMAGFLKDFFEEHLDFFKVACHFGEYLFTHGGLCANWADKYLNGDMSMKGLVDSLNLMLNETEIDQLGQIGKSRGGVEPCGGPIWCDYHRELLRDPFLGINQVVGHTRTKFLLREELGGQVLYDINYLAYSDQPIFVLEV